MRRLLVGCTAALALAILLCVAPEANAETLVIPNTNVQVVGLGPSSLTVPFGGTANFSWAVFNGDNQAFVLRVTANPSDPEFGVDVAPAGDLSLPRGASQEVYVNVTVPADRGARIATIDTQFIALNPVVSVLPVTTTVVARQPPGALGALTAFLVVGAIIAIGFAATYVFERTRIPDIMILIFLGLLLGPIAVTYVGIHLVPPGSLEVATPYFTALALMFILFDGGLNLRLGPVIRKLGLVGLHTGLTFTLSLFGVALVAVLLLGYSPYVALLLAAVLNGTSSAVVIGIVRVLRVSEETKILLILESVVTDVLSIVVALALFELIQGGPAASLSLVATGLGQAFLVSLVLGVLLGLGWLLILRRLQGKQFAYMLTIAALFGLYAFAEMFGGSGAMAAFVFGLILGNHALIGRRLRLKTKFVVDDRIRQFHGELSFVIRTFFFVFLGLVFTLSVSGRWAVSTSVPLLDTLNGTFILFLVGLVAIFLVTVGVRVLAARVVVAIHPKPVAERRVMWSLMGRGLTTAVLASLAFTIPAFTAPATPGEVWYRDLMAPYQTQFMNLAFFIILLTVGATTIGVFASERSLGRIPKPTSSPAMPPSHELLLDTELEEFLRETEHVPGQEATTLELPEPEPLRRGRDGSDGSRRGLP